MISKDTDEMSQAMLKLAEARPLTALVIIFIAWKVLLFFIAIASPGPGYDTSTSLLVSRKNLDISESPVADTSTRLSPLYLKLGRWDAIYFSSIAARGHVYEQEWAWGLGHTTYLSALSTGEDQRWVKFYLLIVSKSWVLRPATILFFPF